VQKLARSSPTSKKAKISKFQAKIALEGEREVNENSFIQKQYEKEKEEIQRKINA